MAALLSLLKGSRSSSSSPMPRYAHASAQVGNKAIVYSGRTKNYSKKGRQRSASVVDVFDPYREMWEEKQTKGDTPIPGMDSAACATIGDGFFMFGGWDERNDETYSLHRLDTKTYHWSTMSNDDSKERPMAKAAGGMVAFGDNLALLGGYGLPHDPIQPGSTFTGEPGGASGLTNECHVLHLRGREGEDTACPARKESVCLSFGLGIYLHSISTTYAIFITHG